MYFFRNLTSWQPETGRSAVPVGHVGEDSPVTGEWKEIAEPRKIDWVKMTGIDLTAQWLRPRLGRPAVKCVETPQAVCW